MNSKNCIAKELKQVQVWPVHVRSVHASLQGLAGFPR